MWRKLRRWWSPATDTERALTDAYAQIYRLRAVLAALDHCLTRCRVAEAQSLIHHTLATEVLVVRAVETSCEPSSLHWQ
jgi:hypothetical protein